MGFLSLLLSWRRVSCIHIHSRHCSCLEVIPRAINGKQPTLSAVPLIGCLGLDKSFNILTHHLLISKLGLLPPSSQHFCDHLNKMILTMTHKVASLPADPHCVPHCPLLQNPAPPCPHFTDLAIHGGKNCYSSHPRAFASALYFYLESSSPIPVSPS